MLQFGLSHKAVTPSSVIKQSSRFNSIRDEQYLDITRAFAIASVTLFQLMAKFNFFKWALFWDFRYIFNPLSQTEVAWRSNSDILVMIYDSAKYIRLSEVISEFPYRIRVSNLENWKFLLIFKIESSVMEISAKFKIFNRFRWWHWQIWSIPASVMKLKFSARLISMI